MLELRTDIEISSTPERVWSILTDFDSYPGWNPFIRSIEGIARVGNRLNVSIQPVGSKAMSFRPVVLAATTNFELRWVGRLLIPGIFDGEHYFQIVPGTTGRVRLVQGEKFNGLLVGLLKSRLERGTRAGFVAMNQALKARAEVPLAP